jgi:hypothetical protein
MKELEGSLIMSVVETPLGNPISFLCLAPGWRNVVGLLASHLVFGICVP